MASFYTTNRYYFIVYENKEDALKESRFASDFLCERDIRYWTQYLQFPFWCSKPMDVFLVLETDRRKEFTLAKVLHGNKTGWLVLRSMSWLYKIQD